MGDFFGLLKTLFYIFFLGGGVLEISEIYFG